MNRPDPLRPDIHEEGIVPLKRRTPEEAMALLAMQVVGLQKQVKLLQAVAEAADAFLRREWDEESLPQSIVSYRRLVEALDPLRDALRAARAGGAMP